MKEILCASIVPTGADGAGDFGRARSIAVNLEQRHRADGHPVTALFGIPRSNHAGDARLASPLPIVCTRKGLHARRACHI